MFALCDDKHSSLKGPPGSLQKLNTFIRQPVPQGQAVYGTGNAMPEVYAAGNMQAAIIQTQHLDTTP